MTESPILKAIKKIEAGRKVVDVCREHAISDATYSNGKAKDDGGMALSDIKRLKVLDEKNRRRKQMYAEFGSKHDALRDVVEKSVKADRATGRCTPSLAAGMTPCRMLWEKAVRLTERRTLVDNLQAEHDLSLS